MLKRIINVTIVFALTFVIGTGFTFAQDDSTHLEFKGIPINGKIDDFVKKLQSQGFSIVNRENSGVIMSGQFTGKEAEVMVLNTKTSKTVWKVVVYLPKQTSWYSIKSEYKYYTEMFTKKYGNPLHTFSFFSDPYYEGDGYEMQAVRNEKCTYYSGYHIQEGNISVEISKYQQIKIAYEDSINTTIMDKEKEDAVINDI